MKNNEKKMWQSLAELHTPSVVEDRAQQEFVAPPMQEELSGMERRDFLKVMGASMAMATAACSRRPIEKIVPYVNQPEEITPGIANFYASTCNDCAAACGVLVKTREGRPIKIEGNDDAFSGGGVCARGQASLLNLYDPDRMRYPGAVTGDRLLQKKSWNELDAEINNKLKGLPRGAKVRILSGNVSSPASKALIKDFLAQFSNGKHISYDAAYPEEISLGQKASYGKKLTPHYRFAEAQVITSFGADFLGTWLSPVEFARDFAKTRKVDEGKMSRLIVFESALSLTGSNADQYTAIRSGDELFIALAVANELIVQKARSRYSRNAEIVAALQNYTPAKVAQQCAVSVEAIRQVADELWSARERGLVVAGPAKAKHAIHLQSVVDLLNSALDNDGVTIDWKLPATQISSSFTDFRRLAYEMLRGEVDVLLINGNNPAATAANEFKFSEALKKVPLVIYFGDRFNETAKLSDYVCNLTTSFEAWHDNEAQKGLFSITQPTIAPLYDSRSFQDGLIAWGASSQKDWHSYLQSFWQRNIYSGANFTRFWQNVLQSGFYDSRKRSRNRKGRVAASRSFRAAALNYLPSVNTSENPKLSLYPSLALFDGMNANNAWLQELPDPISKITWGNHLSVAPDFARQKGWHEGDVVIIKTKQFEARVPVHLQPKMHQQSLMLAVGYGMTGLGEVSKDIGVNAYPFQVGEDYLVSWNGIEVLQLSKTAETVKLANTQGHHDLAGRGNDIFADTTLDEFKRDPHSGTKQHHVLPTLWPGHKYEGYRWGMTIDTTACNGCNACVIACQSENAIPTVGKDQVVRGREMHWMRIDRYYQGDEENPDVAMHPMLCQQCEKAPCETVCPTLATFHSDDGLNMMTYNRCVGTRYCLNNCPYKVRRFNFYDYALKHYKEPTNLALNPDITIRDRGVMEKCTFCVQRIQSAKAVAAKEDRQIADGEVQTACQQSCPAKAITFGNMNDPQSEVAKKKQSARGYRTLEEYNTGPVVTYLTKVRNKG